MTMGRIRCSSRLVLMIGALFLTGAVSTVFVACGGTTSAATRHSTGTTITLHATDFGFRGVPASVTAGHVHVVLINDSKDYTHEVWLYPQQQAQMADMLAQKRTGADVDEAEYIQGLAGHVEDVAPGKTAGFDATLQPGTYEIACFITSDIAGQKMVHDDMGMHALLTVQ
jgi:uncharacterized cupredoxin-like copper-binding protein